MAHLEVLEGLGLGGDPTIPLHDEVFLGRHTDNAIPLLDQRVSRRHARIHRQGDGFVIEDLHSTNGVFLGDARLSPGTPHALQDGDEIRIGSWRLRFHAISPDAAAAPSAPIPPQPENHSAQDEATLQGDIDLLLPSAGAGDDVELDIAVVLDASQNMIDIHDEERQTDRGLQEALRRLQAICRVSSDLIAVTGRDQFLQCVLEHLFHLFPIADRAFVLLHEPEQDTLVPAATKHRLELPGYPIEVGVSHTIVDHVLTHKRAILSFDALEDARFATHASVLGLSIRSMMCAPLLVHDEIIGVLQVDTCTDRKAFTSEDLQILVGIAAQLALAVQNARLNDLANHLDVMATINRIGVALSSEKDTDHLLDMILDAAKRITHADGGALYLMTEDQQLQLSLLRIDSLNLTLDHTTAPPIPLYDQTGHSNIGTVTAYTALRATTINLPDIYQEERFDLSETYRFDQANGYRSQSFLSVPMTNHQHDVIGVLQLINAHDRLSSGIVPFAPDDQRLAESLASQAAVGLSRSKLLQALEESEKRYRDLVENSPGAICMHDLHGTILFVNQSWAQQLGYAPEDLIGQNLTAFLAPATQHLFAAYLQRMHQELTADGLARLLTKQGQERIWSYRSLRYQEADKPPYVFVHTQDITEYRRLEAHLRQAQKMEAIGTLAGGIAHDFNNILSAILGYTTLTMEQLPEDNPNQPHLQRVLNAGKRAKELVQQILAFSRRDESGRKPIPLHAIVEEELQLLRASLPSTIDIHQHLDPASGVVLADPTQIRQVILNLCTNAEHAMRETGGVLEVSLQAVDMDADHAITIPGLAPGAYLCLNVRDTGHGMTRDVMTRVFEPFFTTKDTGEGTGMGLAIIHGIVANHGGIITVKSQAHQGATFTIYLPRLLAPSEVEAGQEDTPCHQTGTHKKTVLWVDDEEPLASLGKLLLEHYGYEAISHTSSVEALALFQQAPQRFDLVITDQTMPRMTGEELVKELRRLRPDLPVMLCTGFSHTMTDEKAAQLGINAFLMKPLVPLELEQTILQVFAAQEEKRG